jgi:zeaxanthin glucosyltransferase
MSAERRNWHFGVLPFTGTGHLNALIALSQELRDRGHKVTFFEKTKIANRVLQAGLGFFPIGAANSSKRLTPPKNRSNLLSEISMLRFNLARIRDDMDLFFRETPRALKDAGVNALLINEIAMTGPTVAEMLRLPYFLISTSVPHCLGWRGRSWLTGYRYSSSCLSWMQSVFLEVSALRMRGPIRRALEKHRRHAGLGPLHEASLRFPPLAHITQLPECLDLPRKSLPGNFHYTAPFTSNSARPHIAFPWAQLDGRPLIYASLGTTRNVQPAVFRLIAQACKDLDVQLVIALGNRFESEAFCGLPGQPVVTRYAPQLELLKLARIVITHGGPNTVLETLMEGKPMLAIPMALDQPAIAARLAQLHAAKVLPVMRLSSPRIRAAIIELLNDRTYRDAAEALQSTLRSLRGPEQASDIIAAGLERYFENRETFAAAGSRGPDQTPASFSAEESYASRVNDSSASIASFNSQYFNS